MERRERKVGNGRIEVVRGDIVEEKVDAIVNAANMSLLGGGGVDGAIHDAAGKGLLEECRKLPADDKGVRCPTGEVRVTGAHGLKARFIIHGVGPIYDERRPDRAADLLRRVYESALEEAHVRGCRSIAFPAISTGVYRYPIDEAAFIAVGAANRFLASHTDGPIELVRFVLFSDRDYEVFGAALSRASEWPPAPPSATVH